MIWYLFIFEVFITLATYFAEGSFVGARPYAAASTVILAIIISNDRRK